MTGRDVIKNIKNVHWSFLPLLFSRSIQKRFLPRVIYLLLISCTVAVVAVVGKTAILTSRRRLEKTHGELATPQDASIFQSRTTRTYKNKLWRADAPGRL